MTSPQVRTTDSSDALSKISTPVQNNYAAPHTPIASAKRPRQPGHRASLNRSRNSLAVDSCEQHYVRSSNMTPVRKYEMKDGADTSIGEFPRETSSGIDEMSPMHPPRPVVGDSREAVVNEVGTISHQPPESSNGSWVGIFSPVLNFLNAKHDDPNDLKQVDGDNDVTMEDQNVTLNDERHQPVYDVSPYLSHPREGSNDNTVGVVNDVELSSSVDSNVSSEEQNDDREIEDEEFNPYLFIKSLPEYSVAVPNPLAKICLPPKDTSDPPITLVLDLDETLVHCTVEPINDADMVFPVTFNDVEYRVHVRTRPYLMEFLEGICKKFEVVVFTASQKVYANELLKRIDPEGKYIKHSIFREACLLVEGNYLKDLNVLNRNLSSTVLVDNSPHAFGYQIDNGIPIESWFDDPGDTELLKLQRFLETLYGVEDVRTVVRSKFQTYKLIRDA